MAAPTDRINSTAIMCRCGTVSRRGATFCRYCENPIVISPNPEPRKRDETDREWAARVGPVIIQR